MKRDLHPAWVQGFIEGIVVGSIIFGLIALSIAIVGC